MLDNILKTEMSFKLAGFKVEAHVQQSFSQEKLSAKRIVFSCVSQAKSIHHKFHTHTHTSILDFWIKL